MLDPFTRQARRNYLGSSDAAAIAGRDRYRTPADVFLEKTGRLMETPRRSEALELGSYLEPAILSWAADRLGSPALSRDVFLIHPNEVLAANLDALRLDGGEPAIIEAKTAGLLGGRGLAEWGEEGTDEVPEHVLLQVHHQFLVCQAQQDLPPIAVAYIPVLLGGIGFRLYRIERSHELCEALLHSEMVFWMEYITKDVMPPDELPSLDTLRVLKREPKKTLPIDPLVVLQWRQAQAAVRVAEACEQDARRALLAALGDAEAGDCQSGTITYLEHERKAYTVDAQRVRQLRWKPKLAVHKERIDAR